VFTPQTTRLLAVEDLGDRAGWPILVHHGAPNSPALPETCRAAEDGVRMQIIDAVSNYPANGCGG
jgi:hypothetical protein